MILDPPIIRTGLGHDKRRFLPDINEKRCTIGGVIFSEIPGFVGKSDGDPVYHAICSSIETLIGIPLLGSGVVGDMFHKDGITNSKLFAEKALSLLQGQKITHIAISIEGSRPLLYAYFYQIRSNIAALANIHVQQVGISASSGRGLSDCSCGDGIDVMCLITTIAHVGA
jgi:2-C-methyl-D-erythritol 2,4-cyclodiphosphate synthase